MESGLKRLLLKLVLSAVVALLLFVAIAAAWLPAHKASAVDPIVALRHE